MTINTLTARTFSTSIPRCKKVGMSADAKMKLQKAKTQAAEASMLDALRKLHGPADSRIFHEVDVTQSSIDMPTRKRTKIKDDETHRFENMGKSQVKFFVQGVAKLSGERLPVMNTMNDIAGSTTDTGNAPRPAYSQTRVLTALESRIARLETRLAIEKTNPPLTDPGTFECFLESADYSALNRLTKRAVWRQRRNALASLQKLEAKMATQESEKGVRKFPSHVVSHAVQLRTEEVKQQHEQQIMELQVTLTEFKLHLAKLTKNETERVARLRELKQRQQDLVELRGRMLETLKQQSLMFSTETRNGNDSPKALASIDTWGKTHLEDFDAEVGSWTRNDEGEVKTQTKGTFNGLPLGPQETLSFRRQPRIHKVYHGVRGYSTQAHPPLPPEPPRAATPNTSDTSADEAKATNVTPDTNALPHLTSSGSAHMVSVSTKPPTLRTAIAVGKVHFSNAQPLTLIRANALKKGDVLSVARIAGIMAAKATPTLIPLCHPIAISHVSVELRLLDPTSDNEFGGVSVEAKVQCTGPTGVEMEALTAVMGAGLTVVDMCKAVDKAMRVESVRVVLKEGGRSGIWKEEGWTSESA